VRVWSMHIESHLPMHDLQRVWPQGVMSSCSPTSLLQTYIHTHTHIYIHVSIYVYLYTYIHTYIYIHIYQGRAVDREYARRETSEAYSRPTAHARRADAPRRLESVLSSRTHTSVHTHPDPKPRRTAPRRRAVDREYARRETSEAYSRPTAHARRADAPRRLESVLSSRTHTSIHTPRPQAAPHGAAGTRGRPRIYSPGDV
jgi:hypothetical protein